MRPDVDNTTITTIDRYEQAARLSSNLIQDLCVEPHTVDTVGWNLQQWRQQRKATRQNIFNNARQGIATLLGWNTTDQLQALPVESNPDYLKQLFSELDEDGGGTIDRTELYNGFIERGAGDRFSPREIAKIIDFIDVNGDGEIDFSEMCAMFGQLDVRSMDDLIEKSYLLVLFAGIDSDSSGLIDVDELRQFFKQNKIELSDAECLRLMREVDADSDGNIDFMEFYAMFCKVKSFDELVNSSRLHVIFNSIDQDESHVLDLDEIASLFEAEQVSISDKELKMMISKIDANGDGVIDFEEFEQAFSMITDIHELVDAWQSMNNVDVGSDLSAHAGLSNSLALLPILAGGCGGIVSRTLTAPLERLKILAQTGKNAVSMRQTVRQLVSLQGFWHGLWKGNFYGCLRIFPFAGTVTLTYTMFLKHAIPKKYENRIKNPNDSASHAFRFMAGLTAGCIATTITYPLDLMKANEAIDMTQTKHSRMRLAQLSVQTMTANFRREMYEHGIHSFRDAFRGLMPTIFAVPMFIGIQNMTYDFLRIYVTSPQHLDKPPSLELFAGCGCVAGAVAQSVVYPVDVIRRRIQTDTMWKDPRQLEGHANHVRMSRIWLNGVVNMIKTQGMRPLFAGLIPTYLKVMPSVAISVTARDVLLGRLNKQ